jgi:eukaryotic-like serine/threonine-protein kinase
MSLPRSFGAHTLLRRLAVGGMAEIYVAKTMGLGGFEKLAALKLVHPHLSADPQFVRMLIDEAKILVLLTHANIAQVFDLGCIDGTYFIAMEYVDGIDVQGLSRAAARLGRELPVPVCCFIVSEMLNGLDYAHRKRDQGGRPLGIVHRDISPQNVVVSRGGEVKLVDFGIAKTNMRVERTEVGVIKGKYGYMSPEQAWADPTDRRSDVFSAGVMLYELLTDSVMYTAKSVAELIAKVRRAEIASPSSVRPEIPEALSNIVMRALALEPSDRFQTALEMGDALRDYLYRSAQAFSGARLGRYVVDLLEADERLARENAERDDETGGLRALRREEFVRHDNSVIFSLTELGSATRNEGVRVRAASRAPGAGGERLPQVIASERTADAATQLTRPPEIAPLSEASARAAREPSPAEPNTEDLTELWTARWFAQRGTALDFVTEIRVQNDNIGVPREDQPAPAALAVPVALPPQASSIAPPTLSWPPREQPAVAVRGRRRPLSPAPEALMPPRGEDPSLAPLPPMPDVPKFRGGARGYGLRELGWFVLLVVLGTLGAVIAWESRPTEVLEVVSVPAGARVRINGSLQPGAAPLRVSGLRRGRTYQLRLELPRYRTYEDSIEAGKGPARRTITMVPD